MLRYLFLFIFIMAAATSVAQKRKKSKKQEVPAGQSSSLAPFYPEKEKEYEPKKKKPTGKVTYDARDKFYDRMEALEKANRKNEREMEKPQYSDPSYFGHKRPPKRRPVNKMKYCKVCGIRH